VRFLESVGIGKELRCYNQYYANKKVILMEFKAQKVNFRQSTVDGFILAL